VKKLLQSNWKWTIRGNVNGVIESREIAERWPRELGKEFLLGVCRKGHGRCKKGHRRYVTEVHLAWIQQENKNKRNGVKGKREGEREKEFRIETIINKWETNGINSKYGRLTQASTLETLFSLFDITTIDAGMKEGNKERERERERTIQL